MSEPVPAVPPTPFSYTERDYTSLRSRLIEQVRARVPGWTGYADPSDFGLALIEAFSYAADGLHYYLDRIANEAYISSAIRPESVREAARIMGYRPARASSASVVLRFHNSAAAEDVTIYPGTRVQTALVNDLTMSPVYFETVNPSEGTVISAGDYADIEAVEGITYAGDDGTGEILGVSNGYSWMMYTLPRAPIVGGFVRILVTYSDNWTEEWSQVEDIRAAAAFDNVFQVEQFPNQPVRIRFGNGGSGAIPPLGAVIKSIYRVGGGSVGNVAAGTITVISDDVSLAGVTVTNEDAAFGGTGEESIESIRNNIRLPALASTDRASSLPDFERIALTTQGVGKAKGYATEESDIVVSIAPVADGSARPGLVTTGGGTAMSDAFIGVTGSVSTSVQKKLTDAAFAGAQITVRGPEYVQIHITMEIETLTSFSEASQSEILNRLKTAFSYENMSFGQTITTYQVQRLFAASPNLIDVRLIQFTTLPDTDPGWATAVDTVDLADYEIGWIDSNLSTLITFVTS